MIKKLIHQPLPVYDSIDKKNRFKEQCHNDVCTFKLITQCDRIIPFVLLRTPSPTPITSVLIKCYDDNTTTDITAQMTFVYSSVVVNGQQMDEIQYFGAQISEQAKGLMYLVITDGTNTWYSEDFYIECCFEDTEDGKILINDTGNNLLINDSGDAASWI